MVLRAVLKQSELLVELGKVQDGSVTSLEGLTITLRDSESHHLTKVRRAQEGDSVELIIENQANVFQTRVERIRANEVELRILQSIEIQELPAKIVLYAGLTRAVPARTLVDAAIQAGASTVVVFSAVRSQGPLKQSSALELQQKLSTIALESLKQSGAQNPFPEVKVEKNLQSALEKHFSGVEGALGLIACAPGTDTHQCLNIFRLLPSHSADSGLQDLSLQHSSENAEFHLVIGPEGGFDQQELALAKELGFRRLSLGPKTLRSEVAVSVGCSLIHGVVIARHP